MKQDSPRSLPAREAGDTKHTKEQGGWPAEPALECVHRSPASQEQMDAALIRRGATRSCDRSMHHESSAEAAMDSAKAEGHEVHEGVERVDYSRRR